MNLSLTQGIFSKTWKSAILRPLLKKTGLDLINVNYRPVSNLSFTSKLVEKAALYQLNTSIERNDLTTDYQSACKRNYSCETALLKIIK